MAFTCQVCFEEKSERLPLPTLKTGNGDVLRADDCRHPICSACLATWVTTRVEEQFVFNLRCPFVNCAHELYEQDVTRLVETGALSKSISERFVELRTRDYTARAKVLSQTLTEDLMNNFDVVRNIWQTMRLCPRCSLAIERSEGCNSFYCICGHHFDFAMAPRIFGNHIRNYGKVIDMAKNLSLSLEEVEKYGLDRLDDKAWSSERAATTYQSVRRISAEAKLSMDEAWDLHQQARSGDKDAQNRIRIARGRTHVISAAEDEEDELFMVHWEDVPSQAESPDITSQAVCNGTDIDTEVLVVEAEVGNATSENAQFTRPIVLEPCTLSIAHLGSRKKSELTIEIQSTTAPTNHTDIITSD